MADPVGYYRANLGSVLAVAEASAEHGVPRVVLSSSAAVYGSEAAAAVHGGLATVPQSPYGATKLMSERIMADAAEAAGFDAVMLRYFNPVGAHRSGAAGRGSRRRAGEPRRSHHACGVRAP